MNKEYTLIGFDDVILDSEERMLDRKFIIGLHDHSDENEFYMFFNYANQHTEDGIILLKGLIL